MGQKVNPHGLRVGIIKNWDSRWYVKDEVFGDTLVSDYNVRKFLKKELYDAGISKVEIERDGHRVRVFVHCAKPGLVIGKGGVEIEKYRVQLEKMVKSPIFKLNNEDETDFLDDVITDNKQAIAMANIYSDILTGTMDAFASVIGNNMNVIMKRLTVISLALMFPTFITGFFGMNVHIPGTDGPWAWLFLAGACLLVAIVGSYVISDRRNRSIIKANIGEERRRRRRKTSR